MKNKITTATLVITLAVTGFFATPAGMHLADHGDTQTSQHEAWGKRTLGGWNYGFWRNRYATGGRF